MNETQTILCGESPPESLPGNAPLRLDEQEGGWRVVAGTLDVFAVRRGEGTAVGERAHLWRAGAGAMVFAAPCAEGAPEESEALVAVGGPETQVVHVSRERFQELARDATSTPELVAMLDGWVQGLTAGLSAGPAARPFGTVAPGQKLESENATNVAPAGETVWVVHECGRSRFCGQDSMEVGTEDGPVPLADPGWLAAGPGARLSTATTAEVLRDDDGWAALARFHRLVGEGSAAKRRKAAERASERLRVRAEAENRLLGSTMSHLAAVVEPSGTGVATAGENETPLFAAFRLVVGRLGMEASAPARRDSAARGADPVSNLAVASHVRARRVLLSERWWRRDNGPILGFRADDQRPVALLPASSSRYEMVDPESGETVGVTEETAREVGTFGYMFYRPFPARALTLWDVLTLGLSGGRRDVLAVVLLGITGGILGMLPPVVMGWIFDSVRFGQGRGGLRPVLVVLLALVLGAASAGLLRLAQGVAVLRIQTRAEGAVEAGLWDRVLNLPASFFRGYTSGDLASRAMGVSAIRQVLTEAAWTTLVSLMFSLVSFAVLLAYDVRLALLTGAIVAALFAVTVGASARQLQFDRALHDQRGRITGLVLQMISGISRLRVAGAESRALALWAREFSAQRRLTLRSRRVSDHLSAFDAAASGLALVVFYAAVAGSGSGEGGMSLGAFLAFNAAFAQILSAFAAISGNAGQILQIVPLYERALPILRGLPEVDPGRTDPGELSGDIEMNHVSFRYGADGPLVLDDVSLRIRPGQFAAFVGPSGAGKSTVLRLLLGFEEPTEGSVYFDRQDFSVLDRRAVRRQMGVVLQNGSLTPGDIFSNIIGTSTLTMDDAWEAARLSGIDQDIAAMPMGMFTVVTDAEGTLSGGQRQRLMIARAIAPRPRILFLDEATSSLDNMTQAHIRESLAAIKATRLVVAHRLSTIEHADVIFVMENGRVVQRGTFQELARQPGLFAELIRRQIA